MLKKAHQILCSGGLRRIVSPAIAALAIGCFALDAAAQVVTPVPVNNPSFEFLNPRTVQGIPNVNRGVDIWEINQDGAQNGNGLTNGTGSPIGGQPTASDNPASWTVTESDGNSVAYDARWPSWDNATHAGPAHGLQTVLLDNRGPGTVGTLKQGLGTLGTLPGVADGAEKLVLNFQARFGQVGSGTPSDASEDIDFYAFFEVNGVEQAIGRFHSDMSATLGANPGERTIETWAELGGTTVNNAVSATPSPVIGNGFTDQTEHMGLYFAELDLAGLNPLDPIAIGFRYEDNRTAGGCCGARTYLDNVSVVSVAPAAPVPEPSSIAIWSLIGLGLAGFGYYRLRRQR